MHQRILLGAPLLLCIPVLGCHIESYPTPANAAREERQAVERLKPIAESIGWDEEGYVISIDLAGHISDTQIQSLLELRRLETLGLFGCDVRDADIGSLSQLPRLIALSLAWTGISDAGVKELKNVKSLRILDLNHTAVTDEGIDTIKNMKSLRTVFLNGTGVTERKLEELEAQLPNCRFQQ